MCKFNDSTSNIELQLQNDFHQSKNSKKNYNLIAGVIKNGRLVAAPRMNVCDRYIHRGKIVPSLHAEAAALGVVFGAKLSYSPKHGWSVLQGKQRKKVRPKGWTKVQEP
jgi:hypothetical protein